MTDPTPHSRPASAALEQLNEIGIALSQESDINRLLEAILVAAKNITNADGGTLYRVHRGDSTLQLRDRAHRLARHRHGRHHRQRRSRSTRSRCTTTTASPNNTHGRGLRRAARPDGQHRRRLHRGGLRLLRHPELRQARPATARKSFLTVPMKNHEDEIIGVLQLINAKDRDDRRRSCRSREADQRLAESLASQAAIALTNRLLINQLEELFESFINLINTAIDDKSPYTGGHCQRVPHAHDDARRGGQQRRRRAAHGLQHDRQGPLRAEDRGPAARLRQGHHAGARGRQGDQAADDLRPHRAGRHALRGAQARRRDRHAASAKLDALEHGDEAGARRRRGGDCAAKVTPARRRPRVPAPLQHRRRAHDARGPGARHGRSRDVPLARRRGRRGRLPHRGRGREPDHSRRHADRGRAPDHQPPHRRHDQDARGAAVAAST